MDFTNGTRERPGPAPGTSPRPPLPASGRSVLDWVRVLRDGLPAVLALVLVGLLVGAAVTALQPTQYRSDATLVAGSSRRLPEPEGASGLSPVAGTGTRPARPPAGPGRPAGGH